MSDTLMSWQGDQKKRDEGYCGKWLDWWFWRDRYVPCTLKIDHEGDCQSV